MKTVRYLDTVHFSIGVVFVAIALLSLFNLKLWQDNRQERRLANEQSVSECFNQANRLPSLQRVLRELENVFRDPEAKADVRSFLEVNAEATPTLRECRQLAHDLEVEMP